MGKLLDLSFVIGVFFVIIGLLLVLHYFIGNGLPVNLWCGIVFAAFGVLMLIISGRNKGEEPAA